eukprot:4721499-Heterocapsa_arctica.AAC.1
MVRTTAFSATVNTRVMYTSARVPFSAKGVVTAFFAPRHSRDVQHASHVVFRDAHVEAVAVPPHQTSEIANPLFADQLSPFHLQ